MSGTVVRGPPPAKSQAQQPQTTSKLLEAGIPSLKVGFWTGTAGVLAGIGGAIAKDANPLIAGSFTGIHWFAAGGTYWFSRTLMIQASGGQEQLRPIERTALSGLSGTAAGAVAGALRGPTKILPTMLLASVVGAGGQLVVNRVSVQKSKPRDEDDSWLATASKWSPLTKMSDREYIEYLEEKRLRVDADIALIDDRIAELRQASNSASPEMAKLQPGK